jgi:hypothetical protein
MPTLMLVLMPNLMLFSMSSPVPVPGHSVLSSVSLDRSTTACATRLPQRLPDASSRPKEHAPEEHAPKDHAPKDHAPKDHAPTRVP